MIRYDENGNPIEDEPVDGQGNTQDTDPTYHPDTPEERKAHVLDGYVYPAFREIYGRDPSSGEADAFYAYYVSHGGEDMRREMQSKLAEQTAKSGGSGGNSSDWFTQNAPAPFSETYNPGTYTPDKYAAPTWNEQFQAPSAGDLQSDPGYQARLDASQRGFERSAASKGSVLSGGFVGRTLPTQLQTIASDEYSNLFGRAYQTYQQRYGQFQDSATRDYNAFSTNEGNRFNAFNTNEAGKLNAYNTRYNAYQDSVKNNLDIARLGLDSTIAGRSS